MTPVLYHYLKKYKTGNLKRIKISMYIICIVCTTTLTFCLSLYLIHFICDLEKKYKRSPHDKYIAFRIFYHIIKAFTECFTTV